MLKEWLLLFKGFCTGFLYTFISIPGMMLVSHYIIKENAKRGFLAALGIITVQVIWSALASLILLGAFQKLHSESRSYAIIGSIILFIMAVKIYRNQVNFDQKDRMHTQPLMIYGAGFFIALTFPIHILGYSAIFATLGINDLSSSLWGSLLPVIGVCFGSFCWWLIFTFTLNHTQKMISPKTLQHFHRYGAMILLIFCVIGLLQLYF
jgi:threonine/homoserine/homoserine lactone efflux protein